MQPPLPLLLLLLLLPGGVCGVTAHHYFQPTNLNASERSVLRTIHGRWCYRTTMLGRVQRHKRAIAAADGCSLRSCTVRVTSQPSIACLIV